MGKYIIILLALSLVVFSSLSASAAADKVKVVSYQGEVTVVQADKGAETAPYPGMTLAAGDVIKTGKASFLDMSFGSDKNLVRVEESSHVVIRLDGPEKLELVDGGIFATLKNLKGGEFQVRTPTAVCGARGTGWEAVTDGQVTTVAVFDNKVFIRGINADGSVMEKAFEVPEGFMSVIQQFQSPGEMVRIPADMWDKIKEILSSLRQVELTEEESRMLEDLDRWGEHQQGVLDRKDNERRDRESKREEKHEEYDPYMETVR